MVYRPKKKRLKLTLLKDKTKRTEKKEDILVGGIKELKDMPAIRKYGEKVFEIITNECNDIDGLEVFVSKNDRQVTPFLYNSAMPSYIGEPTSSESVTLGFRIKWKNNGKISYSASRSVFTKQDLFGLVELARKGAVYDRDFKSLPIPVEGEKPNLERVHHDEAITKCDKTETTKLAHRIVRGTLKGWKEALDKGELKIDKESVYLGAGIPPEEKKWTNLTINGDVGVWTDSWMVIGTTGIYAYDTSTGVFAAATAGMEKSSQSRKVDLEDDFKSNFEFSSTHLSDFKPEEFGYTAARDVVEAAGSGPSKRLKSGKITVEFGPDAVADALLQYGLAPSLELQMQEFMPTAFTIKDVGKQVVSPLISVYDDPLRDSISDKNATHEGLLPKKTVLIKDGVLVDFAKDAYYSNKHKEELLAAGLDPTPRHGYREDEGCSDAGAHVGAGFTNLVIEGNRTVPLERMRQLKQGERVLRVKRTWYSYPNATVNEDGENTREGFTTSCPGDAWLTEMGEDGIIKRTYVKPGSFRMFGNVVDMLGSKLKEVSTEKRAVNPWGSAYTIFAPFVKVDGVEIVEVAQFLDAGTKAAGNYAVGGAR